MAKKQAANKTSAKKATKGKSEMTRKEFILDKIKRSKKGVSQEALIKATNEKFNYPEGKSSRMRVINTLKEATASGTVKANKDGIFIWAG